MLHPCRPFRKRKRSSGEVPEVPARNDRGYRREWPYFRKERPSQGIIAVRQCRNDMRAVLFDLDDKLFDHRYAARCSLREGRSTVPAYETTPWSFSKGKNFGSSARSTPSYWPAR